MASTTNGNGNSTASPLSAPIFGYSPPADKGSHSELNNRITGGSDGYLLPHYRTFSGIVNEASRMYSFRFDEAMRHAPSNAIAMRHDAYFAALLNERVVPLTRWQWQVELDSDDAKLKDSKEKDREEIRAILESIVRNTWGFPHMRSNLSEFPWAGKAGQQVVWGKEKIGGFARQCIVHHRPVHEDKILCDFDGFPAVAIYGGDLGKYPSKSIGWGGDPSKGIPSTSATAYTDRFPVLKLNRPDYRQQFIIPIFQMRDGDYYDPYSAGRVGGVGLRHYAYWAWWLRDEMLAWATDFMEKVGSLGIMLFFYQEHNVEGRSRAEAAARQVGQGNALAVPVPAGDARVGSVDMIPANMSGVQFLTQFIGDYFEGHIERLFVGQKLSSGTEGGGLGGAGVANLHRDTKYHLLASDAELMSWAFTEDLVKPALQKNFPGCPWKYHFKLIVPDPTGKDKLEAVAKANSLGVDFGEDDVRELTGMPKPAEGQRTLHQIKMEQEAQQAQQAQIQAAKHQSFKTGDPVPNAAELAAAMVQVGDQPEAVEKLRGLADDPEQMQAIIGGQPDGQGAAEDPAAPVNDGEKVQYSWTPGTTKGGKTKAIGSGEHEGRTLYGDAAEAALRHQDKAPAAEDDAKPRQPGAPDEPATGRKPAASATPKNEKPHETVERVFAASNDGTATAEHFTELAKALGKMSLKDLKSMRFYDQGYRDNEKGKIVAALVSWATNNKENASIRKAMAKDPDGISPEQRAEKDRSDAAKGGAAPKSAEPAAGDSPTKPRNFTAGMNRGSISFPSEIHRDLYDLGAKHKKQFDNASSATMAKHQADKEALQASLAERTGKSADELRNLSSDVHDDVKAQMKGLKDGEHRHVKDNHGVTAKAEPKAETTPLHEPELNDAAADIQKQHPVYKVFRDGFANAKGLKEGQKAHYFRSMKKALGAMPSKAHDLLAKNLKTADFHTDPAALGEAAVDAALLDKDMSHEKLGKLQKYLTAFKSGKLKPGAAYQPSQGRLHLDGDLSGDYQAHEVYAHALGHALDGPDKTISKSQKWQQAFKEEMAGGKMTKYATRSPGEALAEFSRLLYGGQFHVDSIREMYPKATAVFEARGLLPDEPADAGEHRWNPALKGDIKPKPELTPVMPENVTSTAAADVDGQAETLTAGATGEPQTPISTGTPSVTLPEIFEERASLDGEPDGDHVDVMKPAGAEAEEPQKAAESESTDAPAEPEQAEDQAAAIAAIPPGKEVNVGGHDIRHGGDGIYSTGPDGKRFVGVAKDVLDYIKKNPKAAPEPESHEDKHERHENHYHLEHEHALSDHAPAHVEAAVRSGAESGAHAAQAGLEPEEHDRTAAERSGDGDDGAGGSDIDDAGEPRSAETLRVDEKPLAPDDHEARDAHSAKMAEVFTPHEGIPPVSTRKDRRYPGGKLFADKEDHPELERLERLAIRHGILPEGGIYKKGDQDFRKKQLADAIAMHSGVGEHSGEVEWTELPGSLTKTLADFYKSNEEENYARKEAEEEDANAIEWRDDRLAQAELDGFANTDRDYDDDRGWTIKPGRMQDAEARLKRYEKAVERHEKQLDDPKSDLTAKQRKRMLDGIEDTRQDLAAMRKALAKAKGLPEPKEEPAKAAPVESYSLDEDGNEVAAPVAPTTTPEAPKAPTAAPSNITDHPAFRGIGLISAKVAAAAVNSRTEQHKKAMEAAAAEISKAKEALRHVGSRQPERKNALKAIKAAEKKANEAEAAYNEHNRQGDNHKIRLHGVAADETLPDFVRLAAAASANYQHGRDDDITPMVKDYIAKNGHDPRIAERVASEVMQSPLRAAKNLDEVIRAETTRQDMLDTRDAAEKWIDEQGMESHDTANAKREAGKLYSGDLDRFKNQWSKTVEDSRKRKAENAKAEAASKAKAEKEAAAKSAAKDYVNAVRDGKAPAEASPEVTREAAKHIMNEPLQWRAGEKLPKASDPKRMVEETDSGAGTRWNLAKCITDHGWATDTKYAVKATPEMIAHAKSLGYDKREGRSPPMLDILPKPDVLKEKYSDGTIAANKFSEHTGSPLSLIRSVDGEREATVEAKYVANVKSLYPDVTIKVSGEDKPVMFYSKGKPVGLVMPLAGGKDDDKAEVGGESRLTLPDAFEPGPYTADDVEDFGTVARVGRGKHMAEIRLNEGRDGGYTLAHGRPGSKYSGGNYTSEEITPQRFANRTQALAAAKELLAHAHGMDDANHLIFKPKGQKTELGSEEKKRIDHYAKLRERVAAAKKVKPVKVEKGEHIPVGEHFGVKKSINDKGKADGWKVEHLPTGASAGEWTTRDNAIAHALMLGDAPGADQWGKYKSSETHPELAKHARDITKAFEDTELPEHLKDQNAKPDDEPEPPEGDEGGSAPVDEPEPTAPAGGGAAAGPMPESEQAAEPDNRTITEGTKKAAASMAESIDQMARDRELVDSLTGNDRDDYEAFAPILVKNVNKEVTPRKQFMAAAYLIHGTSPKVQAALVAKLAGIAPKALDHARANPDDVAIGIRNAVNGYGKKVDEPARTEKDNEIVRAVGGAEAEPGEQLATDARTGADKKGQNRTGEHTPDARQSAHVAEVNDWLKTVKPLDDTGLTGKKATDTVNQLGDRIRTMESAIKAHTGEKVSLEAVAASVDPHYRSEVTDGGRTIREPWATPGKVGAMWEAVKKEYDRRMGGGQAGGMRSPEDDAEADDDYSSDPHTLPDHENALNEADASVSDDPDATHRKIVAIGEKYGISPVELWNATEARLTHGQWMKRKSSAAEGAAAVPGLTTGDKIPARNGIRPEQSGSDELSAKYAAMSPEEYANGVRSDESVPEFMRNNTKTHEHGHASHIIRTLKAGGAAHPDAMKAYPAYQDAINNAAAEGAAVKAKRSQFTPADKATANHFDFTHPQHPHWTNSALPEGQVGVTLRGVKPGSNPVGKGREQAYVAKLLGTDPQLGYKRDFMPSAKIPVGGKHSVQLGDGTYEVQTGDENGTPQRHYLHIEGGKGKPISHDQVFSHLPSDPTPELPEGEDPFSPGYRGDGGAPKPEGPKSGPAGSGAATEPAAKPDRLEDFGEKIGGARKDTATARGPRTSSPSEEGAVETEDEQPGWQKRYAVGQVTKSSRPGEEGKRNDILDKPTASR